MLRLLTESCQRQSVAADIRGLNARCCAVLQAEVGTPTEEAPGCGGLQLAVDVSPCAGLRQVAARPFFTLNSFTAAWHIP